jgi:hypothetical protein
MGNCLHIGEESRDVLEMSETITPTLNPIDNNAATVVNVETPSVPQISEKDAFAMDLGDLKKAAFEPAPAPIAQPQGQTSPEPYTVEQGPDGIQVRLSPEHGGEVFKGKDFNEVIAKLAKSKADGNAYIKQLKTQPGTQPNAMPQQFPDPAMQQSPEEAQREAAQFLQSMVLTPEVKQQIVAEAVGIDPRALPRTFRGIAQTVGEFQANNTALEFHLRCPDYVDLPDQTKALEHALGNLEHPATVDDCEKAWAYATYKNPQLRYVPPTSTPAPRPPVMPSAGGSGPTGDQNAWSMDMTDLKKAAGLG